MVAAPLPSRQESFMAASGSPLDQSRTGLALVARYLTALPPTANGNRQANYIFRDHNRPRSACQALTGRFSVNAL